MHCSSSVTVNPHTHTHTCSRSGITFLLYSTLDFDFFSVLSIVQEKSTCGNQVSVLPHKLTNTANQKPNLSVSNHVVRSRLKPVLPRETEVLHHVISLHHPQWSNQIRLIERNQTVLVLWTGSVQHVCIRCSQRLSYSLWTQNRNHFLRAPTDRQTEWVDRQMCTDRQGERGIRSATSRRTGSRSQKSINPPNKSSLKFKFN